MHRACFTMTVAPRHLGTYERLHREAWPELLDALFDAGWRNYSLFLRSDGLLVGYVESDDWSRAKAAMDAHPVSARWSIEMDRLVEPGSRMTWLSLLDAAGPRDPLPRSALRAIELIADIPEAPSTASDVRWAEFGGSIAVRYVETGADSADRPASTAFRRVFDLDRQHSDLTRARAAPDPITSEMR